MKKVLAAVVAVLMSSLGIQQAVAAPEVQTAPQVQQAWDWGAEVNAPCDNKVKMCNGVHPFETLQAPAAEPSASTPVNPKIVKGKAGSGIFDATAPGYEVASPATTVAPSKTDAVAAFDPAPYSSLRWATTPEDANGHPWICISDNLNDSIQYQVGLWGQVTNDLTYNYQVNGCQGWGTNEKIDVQRGIDGARACAYVYKAWNASSQLTRVIVYHNHAIRGCYETTNPTAELSVRHWKSQVIGLGLGNLQFGTADRPTGWPCTSVMDMAAVSYVTPDPCLYDGRTFDIYN